MNISEKAAYIKGLADGMKLDESTNEGKLLKNIIDLLGDFAHEIEDLNENAMDLAEEIDELSDDLADVEEILAAEEEDCCCDDDDDCCCCDDDDDCCCDDDACCCCDEEPVFFEVSCPACGNEITIDEDVLNLGGIDCPNCGEKLEFDLDSIEDVEDDE